MSSQLDDEVQLDDAAGRLSMALGRLTRVLRRDNPSGLGPGSISALATVVRSGPLRLGDLAAREGVTPPTLTRIVVALREGGYLIKTPDPNDGRATQVEATPAAVELITGTKSLRAGALRSRLAALPPDDLAALVRAVPVIEALAADEG